MILAFANIEIDPARGELRRDGKPVAVAPRVFSLLQLLAANAFYIIEHGSPASRWQGQ